MTLDITHHGDGSVSPDKIPAIAFLAEKVALKRPFYNGIVQVHI